jgi:hypothetical protein
MGARRHFFETLVYHLNIIHLLACDGLLYVTGAYDSLEVHVHDLSTPKLPR